MENFIFKKMYVILRYYLKLFSSKWIIHFPIFILLSRRRWIVDRSFKGFVTRYWFYYCINSHSIYIQIALYHLFEHSIQIFISQPMLGGARFTIFAVDACCGMRDAHGSHASMVLVRYKLACRPSWRLSLCQRCLRRHRLDRWGFHAA